MTLSPEVEGFPLKLDSNARHRSQLASLCNAQHSPVARKRTSPTGNCPRLDIDGNDLVVNVEFASLGVWSRLQV
jgi:hypothetical protein